MKARTLIPFFFLLLFLGVQFEVNAQASASVSFTIVVPENFHDPVDDYDRGFGSDRFMANANERSTSSVSVQMIASTNNEKEVQTFETEMSSVNSPAIVDMLDRQLAKKNTAPVADLQTEHHVKDNNQYLVVMEYN